MRRSRASVELFEAIRREYEFGVGTIQGVARKLGVHRRMVREALGSAVPAERLAAIRTLDGHTPATFPFSIYLIAWYYSNQTLVQGMLSAPHLALYSDPNRPKYRVK